MERYKNLSGESGVEFYEIQGTYIDVVFRTGAFRNYRYSYYRPGQMHADRMKQLAIAGIGLNSYIKRYIGKLYEGRW